MNKIFYYFFILLIIISYPLKIYSKTISEVLSESETELGKKNGFTYYIGYTTAILIYTNQLSNYIELKNLNRLPKKDLDNFFSIVASSGYCLDYSKANPFESFNQLIDYFKNKNDFHSLKFSTAILLYNNYVFSKLPRNQIKKCKQNYFNNLVKEDSHKFISKDKGVLYYDEKNKRWLTSSNMEYPKYYGEIENGIPEGQGTLQYKDGGWYSGNWVRGYKSGRGIRIWSDGDKYIGNFLNDKRDGDAIWIFSNGEITIGEFNEDMPWNVFEYDKNGNIVGSYKNGEEIKN